MKKIFSITALTALSLIFLLSCHAATPAIPSAMTGIWKGEAKIIVSWVTQPSLLVTLTINPDGSVSGKIGDATLRAAHLQQNRGWLGRKLNLATDYIIVGDLIGEIVASEHISRNAISIPLNFVNGTFKGGIHTSGSKLGGKESMILSASSLVLTKKGSTEQDAAANP